MSIEQETKIQTARIPSIGAIIKETRPKQMIKNGLVLVPLFFTINIWYSSNDVPGMIDIIGRAFAALGIFVLLSAAVYFINDAVDISRDRAHPRKRHRPIAAGRISLPWAYAIAAVMIIGGLGAAYVASTPLAVTAAAYLAINIAYSWWLKNIVILDVMTVASGFVLRAVAGAIAIDHAIIYRDTVGTELDLTSSPWLYLVTALGALFLALAKRRTELKIAGNDSQAQRSILGEYSLTLLDSLISVVATATLIAYTLYTFGSGNPDRLHALHVRLRHI